MSNYEGADSVSVGKAQIDKSRARVIVSFTYSEDGMLFLWDSVAALHLVDENWLLYDIYEWESNWSLRTRVSIEE